ncbi:formyl transferase [Pseudoalteromonas sp. BMB]|uniref:methionyl-tRNA formyltransferase n=1 Tax=Pseudoalteromonas sp. BMB TaxID=1874619 RepID=UPI00083DACF9|nr:methionyl-tRNA formyltransferase [Pseudoalteromonas sp. BMB]ODB35850.1 formyl transferase [Pseudoalteromonas sp. BMB]
MKIGYFADGPWSHKAIELITCNPLLEVSFIVPRYEMPDETLKAWAEKLNIPFLPYKNVNSPDTIEELAQYGADLFVSLSFNQILKKDIINTPKLGFINCHAGALPFYRGCNPLNWVLINGETEFGVTAHYIDEGIDTGKIIEQRMYPISQQDTYGSLLSKAIVECAQVLYSAIVKVALGEFEAVDQKSIHPVGSYFGRRINGDEVIDFSWPAIQIFNFVRAINTPAPLARFFVAEQMYAVASCELIPDAPDYISTVGEVVGKHERGNVIKVGDSTICFTKICAVEDDILGEAFTPKFKIGTRLNRAS